MQDQSGVIVVGAGIVGVTAALALAEDGWRVTLLDRDAPGRHASRWNAGVLSTSSLVPFGNPDTLAALPRLLAGRSPGFRLAPRALAAAVPWGLRFVADARGAAFRETVAALHALIGLSMAAHRGWLAEAGAQALLTEAGWLYLHETEAGFAALARFRGWLDAHGVAHEALGPDALAELEPHLLRRHARATWLRGSAAVREPGAALAAYLRLLAARGGTVERFEVRRIEPGGGAVTLHGPDGERRAARVVIAAGPWSAALLAPLGVRLPMLSERGYVRRFALRGNATLGRPVHDTAGGLVLSPRPEGVQLSTGSELTRPDLPGLDRQRAAATARAATILPLAAALPEFEAEADRPSLPDGRPAIGPLRAHPGLWLDCGHQHIGFNTAAGSARILAALMAGRVPPVPAGAFSPWRFGL